MKEFVGGSAPPTAKHCAAQTVHGVPRLCVRALGAREFSGDVGWCFPSGCGNSCLCCGRRRRSGGGAAEVFRAMQSNEMEDYDEGPSEVNTTKASHLVKACHPPPPPSALNPATLPPVERAAEMACMEASPLDRRRDSCARAARSQDVETLSSRQFFCASVRGSSAYA